MNYNAPCETLSSSPFSQLPEVHFTLFPLFLKATYESEFYFLNIQEPFPSVLSLMKLILPGKNIHEIMTEFGCKERIQIGCSAFGSPPPKKKNLPKFRESFKPLKPRFGVVMWRNTLNQVKKLSVLPELQVFKTQVSFRHLLMAYNLKTVYMEKSEMPATFSEIIVFIFWNELKEFPELGQNPSEHLKLNNNNNVPTYDNEHLGTVLLTRVNSLLRENVCRGARVSISNNKVGSCRFSKMLEWRLNSKRKHLESLLTSTLMSCTPFVNL